MQMGNFLKIFLTIVFLVVFAKAEEYEIDPAHSNIGFNVKHLKISKVYGTFKTYESKIDYDKQSNTLNALEAKIEAESIDTQNNKRNNHIKGKDFFDIENFKYIFFKMNKFEKEGLSKGVIYGTLTIKGISLPVKFDFEYHGESKMKGMQRIGFSIEGNILRDNFNIANKFPDNMISDKVEIRVDIQARAKNSFNAH